MPRERELATAAPAAASVAVAPAIPKYVRCSAEEWAAAQASYDRLKRDPAWAMQSQWRTSAVAATMGRGEPIAPLLALEFQTLIESRCYMPRAVTVVGANPAANSDYEAAPEHHQRVPVPNAPPRDSMYDWLDGVTAPRHGAR